MDSTQETVTIPKPEWVEYSPPPMGLQYIDTPFGNRIWRSPQGQLVIEPKEQVIFMRNDTPEEIHLNDSGHPDMAGIEIDPELFPEEKPKPKRRKKK
jgi:hypothetical protein